MGAHVRRHPGSAAVGVLLSLLLVGSWPASAAVPPFHGDPHNTGEFVLSPEGNHLWIYDAESGNRQLLIQGENAADPGAAPPAGSQRRDINGQICVTPDGRGFIAGEDTVFGGGSSHDPRIAGWGYFRIKGSELGKIRAEQIGKLSPEFGNGTGYAGDPDNYGCAFLDDQRLLTTSIGDPFPHEPANGQLFLWFGPFDAGFGLDELGDGTVFLRGEVAHCDIDDTLGTAGGIAVDDSGDVYVAANRFDGALNPGGVWRYRGAFPATADECTPEFVAANITKELVVPPVPIPVANPLSPTPSAVVISPWDTLLVSSVFSGKVSEFTRQGDFIRDVYPTAPIGLSTGALTGDTPFGLAFTSDGSLWIADLGIVGVGPAPGQGSLIRVRFDTDGNPTPIGETIQDGLTFPDGLGVYRPVQPGNPRRGS